MTFDQQISELLDTIEIGHEELNPSDWIERNRYVQKQISEHMYGKFKFENTPYMKQIVDHLSPYDPVTHIVLMKGVRIGGTFSLVHNGVPYIISERPTNIMLISANKTLAEKTIQGVDFGIDGTNIRHLIGKGTQSQTNAKGDTMQEKFFNGGFKLFNFGGQSIANMRQESAGFIAADEVDAIKESNKKGGSLTKAMEDRARGYGETKKIVYISSPLLEESSLIYRLYLRGNQNIYKIPCPNCGEYIELVWNERNENNTRYGVIFDVKNGEVIKNSVRYRCGKCENEFNENKKLKKELLNNGIWVPSMERENKNFVSYRISALYAPPSMDNWYDFAVYYQEAFPRGGVKIESDYQTFINSILGWPYKPEGKTLKSTQLQKNRREYDIGECPFEMAKEDNNGEIILITAQCDLNGWEDDGRIDYSIVAHSEKGPTYSIDAGSVGTFIPKVEKDALQREGKDIKKIESKRKKYTYRHNVENSIWTEFEEILSKTFGKYDRKISIVAVDVGAYDDHAKEFIRKMNGKKVFTIAVKGEKQENFVTQSKTEYGKTYTYGSDTDIYFLNVNIIKDRLAGYINASSYTDDEGQLRQDEHFMNFPKRDPNEKKYTYRNFFAHYEAEQKLEKKTEGTETKYIWEKKKPTIQNHFWDVEVYNIFNRILMTDIICSNNNPYKKKYYGSQKIEATWNNACRLIKEASKENNRPLS